MLIAIYSPEGRGKLCLPIVGFGYPSVVPTPLVLQYGNQHWVTVRLNPNFTPAWPALDPYYRVGMTNLGNDSDARLASYWLGEGGLSLNRAVQELPEFIVIDE